MKHLDISAYKNKTPDPLNATARFSQNLFKGLLGKEISLFKGTLSAFKRQQFYHDLATLLSAGVDLSSSLDLVSENFRKTSEHDMMVLIRETVINGESLSGALKQSGKFSDYELYTVRIGEDTGHLVEILQELSVFFSGKIKLQKKLVSSLSYPTIVIITAFMVIWFMISFIVPMFEDVFKRFGQELPEITLFIINFSHGMKGYMGLFLIVISIVIIGARIHRKQRWFRKISSQCILTLPIFGPLIKQVFLARFSLCMHLLLRSRIPLLDSLSLVREMINFYPIEQSLDVICIEIMRGNSLHKSMRQFHIYDNRMISMILVAEETNQLDLMFRTLEEHYRSEIEQKTDIIGNLLEPTLIIFIGLLVGLILVSMYLPMFKLSTSIGG